MIIDFVRSGGKVLLAYSGYDAVSVFTLTDLLLSPNWNTSIIFQYPDTLRIFNIVNTVDIPGISYYGEQVTINYPWEIYTGNNCINILKSENGEIYSAISIPFWGENSCGFICVVSGNHYWEDHSDCVENAETTDTYIFARNILLTMAGVPGYEFDPCAFADSVIMPRLRNCSRSPNPFTPNSDGENDYTYFTFDGIGEKEATIYIYDNRSILVRKIYVPAGAEAKSAARWDGRDENRRSLPQGLYLYVIESDGEVVCEGTVTLAR